MRRLNAARAAMVLSSGAAERTQARNALRALLRSLGIKAPRNLWSRRGLTWLAGLQVAGDLRQERIRTLTEMAFSACPPSKGRRLAHIAAGGRRPAVHRAWRFENSVTLAGAAAIIGGVWPARARRRAEQAPM